VTGDTWEDPGVARLVQSVALLSARIQKRLDDDYPKFTEALLESLYPHYLRPLPSYSIAQVGWRGDGEIPDNVSLLARGSMLRASAADGQVLRFRTVYDVLLAPLRVAALRFDPAAPPRAVQAPRGIASGIALEIACVGGANLAAAMPARLRLFADGEASVRAALVDALFLRAACAWLEVDGDGRRLPLAAVPLRLAGLDEADAMLPYPARSHPALRLLSEYFGYPEKFNFVDLELAEVATLLPPRWRRFTVHLGLAGIRPDGDAARLLQGLDARNLLPGCTWCTPAPTTRCWPTAPTRPTTRSTAWTRCASCATARARR
jgi:type VI secretion system protein ImpG